MIQNSSFSQAQFTCSITFCFPKTQSQLNHFGPLLPTCILRSSLPENSSQKSMKWQKGKHLLSAFSLSNIYTSLLVQDTSQMHHKPPQFGGRTHSNKNLMLTDNNTDTEKTLSEGSTCRKIFFH